ncbi:alpha/beta fold hydrolase [Streptomyces violascens]|uniref:alpha/beta fold hydrolase n=1 Tax=Streptomyces violascens TaxID=67381 RepID=UPI0036C1AF7A
MSRPPRRALLRRSAVLSAAAATATAPVARATPARPAPTFVFIHGNSCTEFFWAPLLRGLALRGHRGLAAQLPGHGLQADFPLPYQAPQNLGTYATAPSRLAQATLKDYAAPVIDTVRRVRAHGPVILVAHSLGGAVLHHVAPRR